MPRILRAHAANQIAEWLRFRPLTINKKNKNNVVYYLYSWVGNPPPIWCPKGCRLIKYSMIIYAYVIAPFRTSNPSLIKYSMFIYAYVFSYGYTKYVCICACCVKYSTSNILHNPLSLDLISIRTNYSSIIFVIFFWYVWWFLKEPFFFFLFFSFFSFLLLQGGHYECGLLKR